MRITTCLPVIAGCTLAEPPTCEDTEVAACFTGAFRTLLGERAAGVEVCTPDLPDLACVVSDADGTWQLPGLPRDADVTVTTRFGDAVDTVFPQNTSMDWYAWFKVMVPRSIMNTNASNLGVDLDPERGNILFIVWEGLNIDGVDTARVPDVTAQVVEDRGAGAVFYANAVGLASRTAVATTANGSGGVLNLEPGVWTLAFDAPGGPCDTPMFHWASTGPGRIPVPVRAGMTTAIDVMCPPSD